jgi:hypothetical protein
LLLAHSAQEENAMTARRRRRRRRSRYVDAATEAGRNVQREAAFAAIRRLYCEALPLWRTCAKSHCRRHRACRGDGEACLPRTWRAMPADVQQRTCELVRRGGPRRVRPATHMEWSLRGYPPANFVA